MVANERNKGSQILIIEDDAVTLHTMRDYLTRAGFSVRTAANGWDALKHLTGRIQEQLAAITDKLAGYDLTFCAGIVLPPKDGSEIDILLEKLELALTKAKSVGAGSIITWSSDILADEG